MTTPTTLATFLADNIPAIAADEAAGELFRDVRNAVDSIERAINRPLPFRVLGPCPTITEDQTTCAVGLTAKREEIEITCWKCHQTHNVAKLIENKLSERREWLWSAREILDIMAAIGEPISGRTWRYWRANDVVPSRNELGAEPKYWLEDVRAVRADLVERRGKSA